MKLECCDNCKFSYGPFAVGFYNLKCRRYPPVNNKDNTESNYPVVSSSDWCGEWKVKESLKLDSF